MVEINFLCVHKKLRSKRVAPVLIKEITRRVNQESIFQAVYTAGIVLPKPIAACRWRTCKRALVLLMLTTRRYWHRSLNPKKLVEVQFSSLHRHMTLQRMMRLYRLPDVSLGPIYFTLNEFTVCRKPRPLDWEWWSIGISPSSYSYSIPLVNMFESSSNSLLPQQYLAQYSLAPLFMTEVSYSWWCVVNAVVFTNAGRGGTLVPPKAGYHHNIRCRGIQLSTH